MFERQAVLREFLSGVNPQHTHSIILWAQQQQQKNTT